MKMFDSWSNMDTIRNGITDAVCGILGLYATLSLGIIQPRENIHISNVVTLFADFH